MTRTIWADTGYAGGAFNPSSFPVLLLIDDEVAFLSWAPVSQAIGYSIYAGLREDALFPVSINQLETTLDIGSLDAEAYAFRVVADFGNGRSQSSYLLRSGSGGTPAVTAGPNPGQINLSFAALLGAIGYNIYLGTASKQESPVPLPQVNIPGVIWAEPVDGGFIVNGLTNGTDYFFVVQPVFEQYLGAGSEVDGVPFLAPPTNLSAVVCDGHVVLSWDASEDAQTYNLYQGTSPGGEGGTPVQTGITGLTTPVNGLTNGTHYYYKVSATGALGESVKSNEIEATPLALGAPSALSAMVDQTTGNIALSWTAGSNLQSYNVLRSITSGGEALYVSGITETSYTDTNAPAGITYYYQVEAVNSCGQISAPSNEVLGFISAYDHAMYALSPALFITGSTTTGTVVGTVVPGAGIISNDPQGSLDFGSSAGCLELLNQFVDLTDNFALFAWKTQASVGTIFNVANGAAGGVGGINFGSPSNGSGTTFNCNPDENGGPGADASVNGNNGAATGSRSFCVILFDTATNTAKAIINGADQTDGSSRAVQPYSAAGSAPRLSLIGGHEAAHDGIENAYSGLIQKFAIVQNADIAFDDIVNLYSIGIGGGQGYTEANNVTDVAHLALSNKNRTITSTAANSTFGVAKSLHQIPASLVYAEAVFNTATGSTVDAFSAGIAGLYYLTSNPVGSAGSIGFGSSGNLHNNGGTTSGFDTLVAGDVLSLYLDMAAGKGWFGKNGVPIAGDPQAGTAPMFTFDHTQTWYIACALGDNGDVATLNLNTSNLQFSGGRFAPMLA